MVERRTYAKGDAKRQEILEAVMALSASDGIHGYSFRELARAVGLTQAGLQHYFSSKDELLEAVLRERDAAGWKLFEDHPDTPMVDQFVQLIRDNPSAPGLIQLFSGLALQAASAPGHSARPFFLERYEKLGGALRGDIAARQVNGTTQTELSPDEIATILIALADGLQVQWLLHPETDMAGLMEKFLTALGIQLGSRNSVAG